jgi:hypothetical protein
MERHYPNSTALCETVLKETGSTVLLSFSAGKRPTFMPILERFWSVGSGRDFALAAMALGKTAKEAIELAHMFDASTGDKVDVIEIVRPT